MAEDKEASPATISILNSQPLEWWDRAVVTEQYWNYSMTPMSVVVMAWSSYKNCLYGWQATAYTNSRTHWWWNWYFLTKHRSNNIKASESEVCQQCKDENPDELSHCDTWIGHGEFYDGTGHEGLVWFLYGYMPDLDNGSGHDNKCSIRAVMALGHISSISKWEQHKSSYLYCAQHFPWVACQ